VGEVTVAGIMPKRVFLLDMPAASAAQRIQREHDRMESQGIDYLKKVREGFLKEAARFPQHVTVINADRSIEAVHAEVLQEVERAFP
jgi:dTMP kinase